jgi:hypothetical protein
MRLSAMRAVQLAVMVCAMILYGCSDPIASSDDGDEEYRAPDPVEAPALPDATARTLSETPARFQESLYSELTCNIETLNGKTFPSTTSVKARKIVHMAGWFFDAPTKTVPADITVRFQAGDGQSAWEQKVTASVDRPDVVKAFGNSQGILKSGFGADLDFTGVKLGEYHMYLAEQTSRGERLCGKWRVTLTE